MRLVHILPGEEFSNAILAKARGIFGRLGMDAYIQSIFSMLTDHGARAYDEVERLITEYEPELLSDDLRTGFTSITETEVMCHCMNANG